MAWTAADFVGGVLALDFANTVGDSTERLADVDDLLGWVSFVGVANQVATLRFRSDLHGDRGRTKAWLRHARNVRGILRCAALERPWRRERSRQMRSSFGSEML